jgi:hypothetical protein
MADGNRKQSTKKKEKEKENEHPGWFPLRHRSPGVPAPRAGGHAPEA